MKFLASTLLIFNSSKNGVRILKRFMESKETFYAKYGKRWFDLVLTVPGFILISPLLGMIALRVRSQLGSPVLFRQVRPGRHGKPFTMYKFRTMTGARSEDGKLLPDAERLTWLGRFLRMRKGLIRRNGQRLQSSIRFKRVGFVA